MKFSSLPLTVRFFIIGSDVTFIRLPVITSSRINLIKRVYERKLHTAT